jgi:hypothetical protein
MKTLVVVLVVLISLASARAQRIGKRLDELLDNGWQPFSAQAIEKFKFVTDEQGHAISVPAYSFFLRRKGGIAYCVRSSGTPEFGFCDIIRQGPD